MPLTRSAKKERRLARWQELSGGIRAGMADATDYDAEESMMTTKRARACSADIAACSCQKCILTRWQDAVGARMRDGRSSEPSSRCSESEAADDDATRGSHTPFAFTLNKEIRELSSSTAIPLAITLIHEERTSGASTVMSLAGGLKLSVSTTAEVRTAVAPERTFQISTRRSSLHDGDEIVYSQRAPSPLHRKATSAATRLSARLDELAATSAQRRDVRACERGDLNAAAELLRQSARSYGTTPRSLLDGLRAVAPPEMSVCLAELLQC